MLQFLFFLGHWLLLKFFWFKTFWEIIKLNF
jgi:hypothetical protein